MYTGRITYRFDIFQNVFQLCRTFATRTSVLLGIYEHEYHLYSFYNLGYYYYTYEGQRRSLYI